MYNIAGPGQTLSEEIKDKIQSISNKKVWRIGVTLSCNKCPELVQAAQQIAIRNKNIEVEIIDVFTFKEFKDKYNIMSVPALVTNNDEVYFGVKNIEELIKL